MPHQHDNISTSANSHQADAALAPSQGDRQAESGRRFLWIYVGITGSVLLRASLLDYESADFRLYLSKWYDYFIEHGRWAGLGDDFSSYPPLYLYLLSLSTLLPLPKLYAIKLISIVFDYLAAWFVFKIVQRRHGTGPVALGAMVAVLFVPTVWLNSAVWGQCDAIFTSALLAAFYFLIHNRYAATMVAFGLAGSFKPQAIFFVPFLAGLFFRERLSWKLLLIPPLVYVLCGVPAMLAGKPLWQVLYHWGRQGTPTWLKSGVSNWYQWVGNPHYEVFFMAGIVLTMIATLFLILAMQEKSSSDRDTRLARTALLSVMLVPFLLPGMCERYFYAADLFSLVYAFVVKGGWKVAVAVQFCSFFAYNPYLFKQTPIRLPWLALVMTVALAVVGRELVRSIIEARNHDGLRKVDG